MTSQDVVQVKGIDTKVETFTPSRSNPVARRVVRKYYAQQPVEGTNIFQTLSFQIEQTENNMVINEIRMVFPLVLKAMAVSELGEVSRLEMNTNSWKQGSNIAVAQNAPYSAFSNLEVAINGKVYTEQFGQYGKVLGQCHQTYSELQFQNDESLKPIANNFMGIYEPHTVICVDGRDVNVNNFQPEPTTFSLLENNSGFIARRRAFEEGLSSDGMEWRGEISSLFNSSLFNSESRAQGNSQIPYVRSLYVNGTFAQNTNKLDAHYDAPHPHFKHQHRVLPQRLFEFLTPMTAAFPGAKLETPHSHFAYGYELTWTAQPYISIEWVKYQSPLLREVYKLRGFQYQLEQTLPFRIPFVTSGNDRLVANPEDRQWVSVRINRQLLQVPNLLYIWVEPTSASAKDCFCWGGAFRTCDVRSLKIRVGGHTEIISNPSEQLLYKWYKRNTNNVHEFPTYIKNKIIVLSPSEIGLPDFLAQDAKVVTIDISLECSQSRLMLPEYAKFHDLAARTAAGYKTPLLEFSTYPQLFNFELSGEHYNQLFLSSVNFRRDRATGNNVIQRRQDRFVFETEDRPLVSETWTHEFGNITTLQNLWMAGLQNLTLSVPNYQEKFWVTNVRKVLFRYTDGFSYWMIANRDSGQVQSTDDGDVALWVTRNTHLFNNRLGNRDKLEYIQWSAFTTETMADASHWNDPTFIQSSDGAYWLNTLRVGAHALTGDCTYIKSGMTIEDGLEEQPTVFMNDSNARILDADQATRNVFTIAEYCAPFDYANTDEWIYEDILGKMDEDNDTVVQKPYLTLTDMKNGWRFYRLADPPTSLLGAGTRFNGLDTEYDVIEDYEHPRIRLYAFTVVERGVEDTMRNTITNDSGDRMLTQHYMADQVMPLGIDEVEYSLNCLCEYNNQTVLLDSSRGKPLHFTNSIRPASKAWNPI